MIDEGALSGGQLTPTEKQIFHLKVHQNLTVEQIQTIRKCNKRVIYKHLTNIKKKNYGALSGGQLTKSAPKKGGIYQPAPLDLTDIEHDLLHLIVEERLTLKQLQIKRNCKRSVIYKHITSLKNKGFLKIGLQKTPFRAERKSKSMVHFPVDSYRPTNKSAPKSPPKSAPFQQSPTKGIPTIRLHGQEFNIKLLFQNQHYQKLLTKSNTLYIDGHTIRLYKNSIEIYAGEGTSFIAENEQKATVKSLNYWQRFFIKLENNLKVILIKNRAQNIKLVNQHYAKTNSETAKDIQRNEHQIRIFTREDGKLWFLTDQSFNDNEREALHPETAKEDSEKISKQLNDWRDHNPPTNSQLATNLNNTITNQATTFKLMDGVTANQQIFDNNMKSHLDINAKISTNMDSLGNNIGSLDNTVCNLGNTSNSLCTTVHDLVTQVKKLNKISKRRNRR